jgi:hypothetical protein
MWNKILIHCWILLDFLCELYCNARIHEYQVDWQNCRQNSIICTLSTYTVHHLYLQSLIPWSSWNEIAVLHVTETARRKCSVCVMVLNGNENIYITLILWLCRKIEKERNLNSFSIVSEWNLNYSVQGIVKLINVLYIRRNRVLQ